MKKGQITKKYQKVLEALDNKSNLKKENSINEETMKKFGFKYNTDKTIRLMLEQALSYQRDDEIEFISYVLTGDEYTKEYYIKMLRERLSKLKEMK